jgi:hypothetical protein
MPSHKKRQPAKKNRTGPIAFKKKRVNPPRKAKRVPLVTRVCLPCQIKRLMQGRADEPALKQHFTAIEKHRREYQNRLTCLTGATFAHARPAWKAKVTEAIGEREATLHVLQEPAYAGFELFTGFAAGTGFDQVWYKAAPTETFLIVEAKGPGATLSTDAAKGPQMSKQWVRNTLIEIINSPTKSNGEKDAAEDMLEAMDNGPPPEVRGAVITAQHSGGARSMANPPDNGVYHA